MRKAQLPTEPMADLLLAADAEKERPKPAAPRRIAAALGSLLSSHPATALRARQLKQGRLEGC